MHQFELVAQCLKGDRLISLMLLSVQEKLPAAKEGGEPLPEGLLWLLLTGEVRLLLGYKPHPGVTLACSGSPDVCKYGF